MRLTKKNGKIDMVEQICEISKSVLASTLYLRRVQFSGINITSHGLKYDGLLLGINYLFCIVP